MRIKLDLDRAWSEGRRICGPQALSGDQVEQCLRMAAEGAGLEQIARVMQCSPATVKRVIGRVTETSSDRVGSVHTGVTEPPAAAIPKAWPTTDALPREH